jgi:predicted nucleic acid-binding protein
LHKKALRLATQIKLAGKRIVTTHAVMLEIGNSLSKLRYRRAAVSLLYALEVDPWVTIVPFSEEFYARAFKLYRERMDKEWGLVDCMSFVVMSERGITDALTTDKHFQQAGFRALLREN